MSIQNIIILALVQGLAELLPVSSSAHVVVAEKLLGLDPAAPPMTLLLVMLHSGTMFAVIVYFWREWRSTYFQSRVAFGRFTVQVVVATLLTMIVGGGLTLMIRKTLLADLPRAEVEDLFGRLELVAPALAIAGILIFVSGIAIRRRSRGGEAADLSPGQSAAIGAVQGLCLPFRGLSRSGTTISTGLMLRVARRRVEAFSFALAVVLTPPVVIRESWRLLRDNGWASSSDLGATVMYSLLGAAVAFLAGLAALRWLSKWLETDRWYLFGIYCLGAAAFVAFLHQRGY
jgi:undecaprenyl-diphosphatase